MKYALQLALLAAFSGSVQASERDGEPTSGRITPVTVPSYRVVYEAPRECKGDPAQEVFLTIRLLDVLETKIETVPIAWKNIEDERNGRTNNPEAGQMQIKVLKPSYISLPQLFSNYVEATTCLKSNSSNCTTTWSRVEGIKTIAPMPE